MQFRFRLWIVTGFVAVLVILPTLAHDVQDEVYVEASVDNAHPYVGQQIIYTFKLFDAVGLTNPLYQPSDFEGFWRVDIGVVLQTTEQINGRQYTVTTIATALYAAQAGEVIIKPPSVVLPETVFREKRTLTANPLTLTIQALPDGQPADFGGAVGQFNVSAVIDQQSVNLGEPITMTLTVSGTGNIEQLPPPIVPQNWRSTVKAENYSSEGQNGIIVGKRDYQIMFFPTASGKQELPPIMLSYFDPIAVSYRSVGTSPVEIEVLSGLTDPLEQPQVLSETSLKLKSAKNWNVSVSGFSNSSFVILFLVPLIGVLAIFGWRWTKIKRHQHQIIIRQQQAFQIAIQKMNNLAFSDTQSGYEQISCIVQRYVADKLNIDWLPPNKLDILPVITMAGVPKLVVGNMIKLIEEVEEGLFAPSMPTVSLSRRDEIARLLTDIDRQWAQK